MNKPNIQEAINTATLFGGVDGGHHKAWVIDQMVRSLTGCPTVTRTFHKGLPNEFVGECLGESEEYHEFLRQYAEGEDGPHTYQWDIGIAP